MHVLAVKMQPYLIPALAEQPDVELTVLGDPSYTPSYADVAAIREVIPYAPRGKFDRRAIGVIRDAIQRHRVDLIHAFYGRALTNTILATSWMTNPPPVVSYRGITSSPTLWDPANWFSYRHPRVAHHACESQAVQDAMVRSGVPDTKCHITYNCVPINQYKGASPDVRVELDLPEDAFVFATVATMRRVKGIDLLLQAAKTLCDRPNVYWLLIGKIKDRRIPRLLNNPQLAERVRLAGHRPDAASLVSCADAFVLPSRAEALSVALLEAMLQGVCPLVSDAGGMKELVRNEQDGLVVPRNDIEALATAMRRLCDDRALSATLGENAAQRIHDFATPQRMAERTARMYANVVLQKAG